MDVQTPVKYILSNKEGRLFYGIGVYGEASLRLLQYGISETYGPQLRMPQSSAVSFVAKPSDCIGLGSSCIKNAAPVNICAFSLLLLGTSHA